jgi:serine/threonine protein kinase
MNCDNCQHENSAEANFCQHCGDRLIRPSHDATTEAATLIKGRYEVKGFLGKGGMGAVFRAQDTVLTRTVAIKRIRSELAGTLTAERRFTNEAVAIARLSHPNIVQVYDLDTDEHGTFIIMEYVDGETLSSKIERDGPIPSTEGAALAKQLSNALAYAHERGIIHRDVKPSNVLIDRQNTPKLVDFGLVRYVAESTSRRPPTTPGQFLGTFDYAAPEQLADSTNVDSRSDLYSLAATLYEIVTGRSPAQVIEGDVPSEIRPIVLKGMEHDPNHRYQDANSFTEALTAIEIFGQIQEIDIKIPSIEIDPLEPPQFEIPGLPEIPDDIVRMESDARGVEQAIAMLQANTHPSLLPSQTTLKDAKHRWKQLEAFVDSHAPEIPIAQADRLAKAVEDDFAGAPTTIGALAPNVSINLLLPHIQRLRNCIQARRAFEAAQQQFNTQVNSMLADLTEKADHILDKLTKKQDLDLTKLLCTFFQQIPHSERFPLDAWLDFHPKLEKRRYRFDPSWIHVKAEITHKHLDEEITWLRARENDDLSDYEKYIFLYPDGRHSDKARARYDALEQEEWDHATNVRDAEAYARYIDLFPDAFNRERAEEKIDEILADDALDRVEDINLPFQTVSIEWNPTVDTSLGDQPPIAKEILAAEGQLAGLHEAVRMLKEGTHPGVRQARTIMGQAEELWKAMSADQNLGLLSEHVDQLIELSEDRNPLMWMSVFGFWARMYPDIKAVNLVQYIRHLIERNRARLLYLQTRERYEQRISTEIGLLKSSEEKLQSFLDDRKKADLDMVLYHFFESIQTCERFPFDAWGEVSPSLQVRRYRWNNQDLLRMAEVYFRERRKRLSS